MKRRAFICVLATLAIGVPTAAGLDRAASPGPAVPTDPYAEIVPPREQGGASLFRGSAGDPGGAQRAGHHGGKGHHRSKGGKTLLTGFGDPIFVGGDEGDRQDVLDKAVGMNGSVVRLYVPWRDVAPATRGAGFDPTDPASGEYNWTRTDAAVSDAASRGLRPVLMIYSAPDWAEGGHRAASAPTGTWKPRPKDLADFGRAISRRYSGGFQSLPRVRDYMVWNEPNLPQFLTPQYKGRKLKSGSQYRKMLNAFYKAVHGVSNRNRVITGGTAPYGGGPSFGDKTSRPLVFWRDVMCVKGRGGKAKGTKCHSKPMFDVLSHHPIDTSGGPMTSAISPDDVSMPDVHNLVDVLRAAEKAHNIKGKTKHHQMWADEFWWESNPPDKYKGNPSLATQAKWYEQSLYLLWKQGVSVALFYQVKDDQPHGAPGRFGDSAYETGVYFANGKAKPSSRAVRFPFVVTKKSKKKALIWGIAPKSGKLAVKQKGKGPKSVTKFRVKAGKVFTKTVRLHKGRHQLTAKVGGQKSLKWQIH